MVYFFFLWFSLNFHQAYADKPNNPKITVSFKNAEIKDVLRSIGKIAGVNIVIGNDVQGNVTVQLKDVSLEDALNAILTVNGYHFRRKGGIILVEKGEEILNTEVIALNFSNAEEVKKMVEKLLSEKGDIKVNERLNELIVIDYEKNINKIKKLIEYIDRAPLQVRIESKIIELELGDLENLGIRWKTKYSQYKGESWARDSSGNLVYDSDGNLISENWYGDDKEGELYQKGEATFDLESDDGVNSSSLTGGQLNIAEFANIAEKLRIGAAIDALIQDKRANILSAPSITTLNNKQASIVIGEKVGIREQTQTTTGTTESVRFEDVGIKLYVTPKISNNGYITMHIQPEISSISVYTETQQRFSTTQAETNVRVKDGHTVIIGGLIKNNEAKTIRKIPILGSIPILGLPFRYKNYTRTKNEIIIFLTPKILKQGPYVADIEDENAPKDYEEKRSIEAKAREKRMLSNFAEIKKKKDYEDYTDILGAEKDAAKNYFKQAKKLEKLAYKVKDIRKDALFKKAVVYYLRVAKEYKNYTKYAPESLYRVGKIYYKYYKNYSKSEEYFRTLINEYPESKYARKAVKYIKKIERKKSE